MVESTRTCPIGTLPHVDLTSTLFFVHSGVTSIVNDSFSDCFVEPPRVSWTYTWYLTLLYCVGVLIRYFLLLPIRLAAFLVTHAIFITLFVLLDSVRYWSFIVPCQRALFTLYVGFWHLALCVVRREHGTRTMQGPGRIFVANHTTLLDVLAFDELFGMLGQRQSSFQVLYSACSCRALTRYGSTAKSRWSDPKRNGCCASACLMKKSCPSSCFQKGLV